MRITRKVFHDLAIWMIAFGLLIGIVFPFFAVLLGVSTQIALSLKFFLACLGAGALAGMINFVLARVVVGSRMRLLARAMTHIEENLLSMTASGDLAECSPEDCLIEVDSEDEIGESAEAFNLLVESLAHSMETQAAVRSFSEMLSSKLELEGLTQQALQQFLKHTGASGGAILCESGGELEVAASHGLLDADSLANSDHIRLAIRTGESQTVSIPDDIQVDGVLAQFHPSEIFILPATYKSIPLGVVVLASAGSFDADARTRMELFRHTFGLALNNALAHDRLQRLAALDPLTGAYNRRFGLGRLHEEFERAVRMNSPMGVLMMDIDHFKQVNDTYGHLVGDRLLVAITGIAKSILREGDVLIRYGGEEFLAVLPAASSEDLHLVGERVRRAIEDASVTDGSQTIRVTMSLGAAAYPNQNVEKENELIQLADAALYEAKESGRNRLILSH
jgi:two-component system, cell cycle response regulator